MGDFISREAALDAQNKSMNLAECRKRLERLPAADVVEVVRCRECVFGNMPCAMARYPDYFCADGERKDGVKDDG